MIDSLKRIWSEGFRFFFLAAGLFAVVAVGWWEVYLAGLSSGGFELGAPFVMSAGEWHARELVFGYGGAALAGFLLTAVPNWTGQPGASRTFVGVVATVWLVGRLAVFSSGVMPLWMAAVADLAFVPLLWTRIALLLMQRRKPQNMLFLVFLTLFWIANLATWTGHAGLWVGGAATGERAGLLALAGMILVIAGRVGPGFTRNAMNREGVSGANPPRDWAGFTPLMLAAAVLLPASYLIWPGSVLAALIAIAAGLGQLVRQSRWGWRFAAPRPILAILHLAAALTGLGLLALGVSRFTDMPELAAVHLLGIGGVGGMTLAMMSRATLGHSGRPLNASRALAVAYMLLPLAAVLRWAASIWAGVLYFPGILVAGGLWIVAFALYLWALMPAFTDPPEAH